MCAIVPASDTGAFEMAMWTMLGARGVDALAWESFGKGWVTDVAKQLKLKDLRVIEAEYGRLPDLGKVDFDRDVLFTWNGTTSGVRVPNGDWIAGRPRRASPSPTPPRPSSRSRSTGPRSMSLTFSWQKVLGGEAAHGMLILSPARRRAAGELHAALAAAEDLPPDQGRQAHEGGVRGRDHQHALDAVRGGLSRRARLGREHRRPEGAATRAPTPTPRVLYDWVERTPWVENLAVDPATRSNTSVCLKIVDPAVARLPLDAQRAFVKQLEALLDKENAARDIAGHRDAPPGLRIWCGSTVETADLEALTPWLDWAFAEAKAGLAKAA